ncbi:MAG: DUF547 domain-containing protein [Myxococcota bacterium]
MLIVAAGMLSQPALAFDHQHSNFAKFLDGAVSNEGVDYGALKGRKELLTTYLDEVANASVSSFSKDEKLAFYVNAYNAITLNLILTENPKSIQDLDGGKVWDQRSFPVGRAKMTLNQIEQDNVRKLENGRIHAVVNCASKGCPPLPPKPLVPTGIQAQLDEAAKRWVSTNAFKLDGDIAQLNKIFLWYGDDFSSMAKGTASEADKQKAGAEFITKYGGDLSAAKKFEWREYDWSVNAK